MDVSHLLLTSVLFLLPFIAQVSAQQPGCSVSNNKPSVEENNPPGYNVTTIDLEAGFTATIDPSSSDASYFTIEGSQLQLVKSVDYETDPVLIANVVCRDTSGQTNTLDIIVSITNLNDNTPVFKQTSLTITVPEDTKVNATIIPREDLSASDADLDMIFYELNSTVQDTTNYFAIKGINNPEIYLQKQLDYDKLNSTTLFLYARDSPVSRKEIIHTATATINIIIEQADNKPPWFLPCSFIDGDKSICISSPYSGRVNISEMSKEPLTLDPGPIYAKDPDYTINEKIVYSIVGGNVDNTFSVDADTGNLTMNKAATSPDSYLLQVMAAQVNNKQKYSIVSVEIKVINKSDNAPYFEPSSYTGIASVGAAPKSLVFQAKDPSSPLMIKAEDDDFPDKFNPNIEYYIKNSTNFVATRDGLILTNVNLLSPETVIMEAVAKDTVSLQEASTIIVVKIVFTATGCSASENNTSVEENNLPGYNVTTINLEAGFTASIDPSSLDASYFTIEGSQLQLVKSVDYETDPVLIADVVCRDTYGQTDTFQIIVNIINLNDNTPVFKQTSLTITLPEDTKVNATIIPREDLSASDADLDMIYYELNSTVQDTTNYFAIKGINNPEIYLQKQLDYDKLNSTTLFLHARDRPVSSNEITHTATATINIIIEQADTKPPWFLPCSFIDGDTSICISSPYSGRVNISEMSKEPLTLDPGPIYAKDPDYTINEKIVYSIVGGNVDNTFSVDANTGNLTMNKAATSPDSYLLQVMAAQVNNKQKYSIVSVEIKVINKSNYAPYFEPSTYTGIVSVGAAPKSLVFQAEDPSSPLMIKAEDGDFPDKFNPNIEYYIKNSTNFVATRDGLILTNVNLLSPETVIMEAVAKDTVSLQEASTIIVVEIVFTATDKITSDKLYTAQDMGILGGILAALLLITLIFLGLMIYKHYGTTVKFLINKKFSKDFPESYENQAYNQDEHPDLSAKEQKSSENGGITELQQPSFFLSSSKEEIDGLPKTSTASTVVFDVEEKEEEENEEEEVKEDTKHEKEVKSILKTDRNEGDHGYKAVWFKTDVDPDAGEKVEVIKDNASDYDDDSDQDLQENEEEEDDKDDHHRGSGAAEVMINMSRTASQDSIIV
ncbi:cadherin-related family member 5 isoform X1 [Anas acuta]|uniref:cadherin-related family member 5 isoform X1 n=1 Tax=Anas acuta TaxID=28680 RepID=UPI0035C8CF5C